MILEVPHFSLIVLVGPSGSGKSTFAARHFQSTEVVSSDRCRGLVTDNEADWSVNHAAFDVVFCIVRKRLEARRLTVVDATSVRREDRKALLELAASCHAPAIAVVLDLPPEICHARNAQRPDRAFGADVVQRHHKHLRSGLDNLADEGFFKVAVLSSEAEVNAVEIVRTKAPMDLRHMHGPFDIIGDIHGCYDEMVQLLAKLGYRVEANPDAPRAYAPAGRKAIFLGDLVDRGPNSPAVLRLVMSMVQQGDALCVPGNHDAKLFRKLKGHKVKVAHGLGRTLKQLAAEPPEFTSQVQEFIDGLVHHYVLDDGRLVVAHAGLIETYHMGTSNKVQHFALFGDTTGERAPDGLPIRRNWALGYRGQPMVVYGHTPTATVNWLNHTTCIDTGCVFGGLLTALRYPEREFVQVPARERYYVSPRPLKYPSHPPRPPVELSYREPLDINDLLGKRFLQTRYDVDVRLSEAQAIAGLPGASRLAAQPGWVVYLPPQELPIERLCTRTDFKARLQSAVLYHQQQGVKRLAWSHIPLGSRAVAVLCASPQVAEHRFGAEPGVQGLLYDQAGRSPAQLSSTAQQHLIGALTQAFDQAELWQALESDWVALELTLYAPQQVEAQRTLARAQGTVTRALLTATHRALDGLVLPPGLAMRLKERGEHLARFEEHLAPTATTGPQEQAATNPLHVYPLRLLASEGAVHTHRDITWQQAQLDAICTTNPELLTRPTSGQLNLDTDTQPSAALTHIDESLLGRLAGIRLQPLPPSADQTPAGPLAPTLFCATNPNLWLHTGPLHSSAPGEPPADLLQQVTREQALTLEALQRYVDGEPLFRVHECIYGMLALRGSSAVASY